MAEPRAWSLAELTEDAGAATDRFRRSRLNEPLEQYTRFFETFTPIFSDLIDRLPSLTEEADVRNAMAGLVEDDDVRTGFRYLSAPPISEDDLKILAQTTLTASVLRRDAEQAKRIRDVSCTSSIRTAFPGSWKNANRPVKNAASPSSHRPRSSPPARWKRPGGRTRGCRKTTSRICCGRSV